MNLHKDFGEFKSFVKQKLRDYDFRRLAAEGLRPSAVAILFMNKNGEPHVLFTKRSENVSSHNGQISFPGGRVEISDKSLAETAFRETFEEIGISADTIELLGRFDDYITKSGYHVASIVGAVPYPLEYKLSQCEVDKCIEAPAGIFANKAYTIVETRLVRGKASAVYHYIFDGVDIWGLTAQILTDFFEKLFTED